MEALQQENHCSDTMATEQGSIPSHQFRTDMRASGGALLVSALIVNILHIIGHVDCYKRVVHAGVSAKGINPIKRLKIFLQFEFVIVGHNRLCTWTPGGYNKEVQRQQLPHWQLQNSCRGWNSALCWGNVSALITNFNIINFRKTLQMYLTSKHAVIWGLYN